MNIGEVCTREVVTAGRRDTVTNAAELMRKHHVGDLLVTDRIADRVLPVGIVTDRDIVIEVVAPRIDPDSLTVGDIMGQKLITARESEGVFEVLQRMRVEGIRRIPVVDQCGGLVGIMTIDDLLEIIAEELSELSKLVSRQKLHEQRTRPAPLSGVSLDRQQA